MDFITTDDYIASLPEERQKIIRTILQVIQSNIPEGFEEVIIYNMIGFVVPHKIYASGYHCDSKLPLPFINLASQKNYISLYHMGTYADEELLKWFIEEYPNQCNHKLNMGKSCIRFKKMNDIPYKLIGELVSKMSVGYWIQLYEKNIH